MLLIDVFYGGLQKCFFIGSLFAAHGNSCILLLPVCEILQCVCGLSCLFTYYTFCGNTQDTVTFIPLASDKHEIF